MGKNRLSRENIDLLHRLKTQFPDYYKYYGRKISKKLSKKSLDLMNEYYQAFSLDEEIINYHELKKFNKKLIFTEAKFNRVNIEIGFGNGEFLLKSALANPDELFIGSEFYVNGIAKVLKEIVNLSIHNLKLTNLNSIYLLQSIQSNSVDKIYILNPDPWKKKRHHKRRLISADNLKLFNKVIKSKKSIYITTDSKDYLKSIKEISKTNREFFGILDIEILSDSNCLYGVSRYQRKAIENGGKIYLVRI